MPILDLQRSLRRLGRIRMGQQVASQNGKMRPAKLETWRMTSPSREMLEAAAHLYGGEVHEWAGSPSGQQWELFTEADTVDAVIPPGEMAFSQWYELWSGGGCLRRCDGHNEQMSGDACLCPADHDDRRELSNSGQACKPTTRLFVIQPHLPDVGMWMFESHGFYAAVELAASIEILRAASAAAGLIPAKLRIEQRQVKREGRTNNFAVPVIELPTLTAHALMTGKIEERELVMSRAEIEAQRPAPATPVAIEAAPTAAPAAAPRSPAATRQRQSRPASTGDTAFGRVISQRAQRAGLSASDVDAISREVAGMALAEIPDNEAANRVLAAIEERGRAKADEDDGREF